MKAFFLNHAQERCGVFQFGDVICNALMAYSSNDWTCLLTTDPAVYWRYYHEENPDVVVFNYHPAVSPVPFQVVEATGAKTIGIVHEKSWLETDPFLKKFDYLLTPDKHFIRDGLFTTNRVIPDFTDYLPPPERLTIGSFGFGFGGKGYDRLVTMVQEEFDDALIRLHIPFAYYGDNDGANANWTVNRCKELLTKPGIDIEFSHNFLSRNELIQWLNKNTLNAFLYEDYPGRGISSVIDYALAARRPVAVTYSHMFRHLATNPSIRVEDKSLTEILETGIKPLKPLYEWTEENLAKEYDEILRKAL